VKPDLPSATSHPSPVASLSNPATTNLKSIATKTASTTTTTKATGITVPPKPQQTLTTKNINAISPSTVYVTWATISLLSNTSSLPSSTIAPQIAAVSQQQQSPHISIARVNSTIRSNGTAGQNYTFAATSPVPSTSNHLIYLGYHGGTKSSHGNDGSKHDDSSDIKRSSTRSSSSKEKDPKPFTPPRIKIVATDNDSIVKKKASSTKVDKIDSVKPPKIHNTKTTSDDSSTSKKKASGSNKLIRSDNSDSKDDSKSNTKLPHVKKIVSTDSGSSLNKKTKHSDDSTDTTPSRHKITRSNDNNIPKDKTKSDPNDDSTDTTSSSHNSKSSSIIENDIPSVIIKSFNPKLSTDSDSSDEGGDSFFGGDKFFSDEGDDDF
ncbi:MAG TPA: hypothetical protein VE643_01765, partial [Nitrososphaeraceae archaeon]|nr:hypothetical protein [Nitrososphaeraceae archaeon]